MGKLKPIKINSLCLDEKESLYPEKFLDDLQSQLCPKGATGLTDILIVLSTGRSGSSAFCNALLYVLGSLGGEYFHPNNHVPILARRWGCIIEGVLDEKKYIQQLLEHRTGPNGWAIFKVHASHCSYFERLKKYFPDVRVHYVHIMRENIVEQSISLGIAEMTGQWRSDFKCYAEPKYRYDIFEQALRSLKRDRLFIWMYIANLQLKCETVTYEDFFRDPECALKRLSFLDGHTIELGQLKTKKQATSRNQDWVHRFAEEYIQNGFKNSFPPQKRALGAISCFPQPIRKILRKIFYGIRTAWE